MHIQIIKIKNCKLKIILKITAFAILATRFLENSL